MKGKQILVFIEGEGGGSRGRRKYNDGEFRKAWKQFLQPLADLAHENNIVFFRCIPGRGGTLTLDTFANPLPGHEGALRILVIDSEAPVSDVNQPWSELKKTPPAWADDKNCYLLVQCLETWLLADVESLKTHYNKRVNCFNESKIKAWPNLEATPKLAVQAALEQATAKCSNPYTHSDGNLLIAVVQRERLKTLPSVARLFQQFEQKIREYAKS
jgi:hypothetical protein